MSKEIIIKKCKKCGAVVRALKDCNCEKCGIKCCEEEMKVLKPNSVDAAMEKHIPVYQIEDGVIVASVNHVMEEDHYIEWISFVSDDKEVTTYFKPGDKPIASCIYTDNLTIYAYCNKHELWKIDVE